MSLVQDWNRRRMKHQLIRYARQIQLTRVSRRIQVVAPYDDLFAIEAREFGRWRTRSQVWSFACADFGRLQTLIRWVFGVEVLAQTCLVDLPPKTQKV